MAKMTWSGTGPPAARATDARNDPLAFCEPADIPIYGDPLPQLLEWPAKTSSDSLRSCFRGSAHVRQTSKQWRSTPSRQARICNGDSPAQSPLSVRLSKRHVFEARLQRGAGGEGPAPGIVLSPVHRARSLLKIGRASGR